MENIKSNKLSEAREQFPITRQMIYLDAACTVPPPDGVTQAVNSFFQQMSLKGEDRQALEQKIEGVCQKFAGLIHATPEEIVLIKETELQMALYDQTADGAAFERGDPVYLFDVTKRINLLL